MKTLLSLTLLVCLVAVGLAQAVRGPNSTASSGVAVNTLIVRSNQTAKVFDIVGQVHTNQDIYIMVFDRAALLTNGTVPQVSFLAFGELPFFQSWPLGRNVTSGLVVAASSGARLYTNCGPVITVDVNYYDAAY